MLQTLYRVSEFDRWFAQYRRVGTSGADVERIVRAALKGLR